MLVFFCVLSLALASVVVEELTPPHTLHRLHGHLAVMLAYLRSDKLLAPALLALVVADLGLHGQSLLFLFVVTYKLKIQISVFLGVTSVNNNNESEMTPNSRLSGLTQHLGEFLRHFHGTESS